MNRIVICQICQNCQQKYCCCKKCFDFEIDKANSLSYESKVNGFGCDKCCCHRRRVFKRICKKRDRAPSRICLKKIHSLFHLRGAIKRSLKNYNRRNVPCSSRLRGFLRANVRIDVLNRVEYVCFWYFKFRLKVINTSAFYCGQGFSISSSNRKYRIWKGVRFTSCWRNAFRFLKVSFRKQFFVVYKMLLLCGDIERNPGPFDNFHENVIVNRVERCYCSSLLQNRLRAIGLVPSDCGEDGDCFFRSVSHQLFGSATNHLTVRVIGVEYLRNHPEEFLEFLEGRSWSEYLSSMCKQGTWCDALIVQAVANAYNLRINFVESAVGFSEQTVVEAQHSSYDSRTSIVIGHVDEYHYVSTVPVRDCASNQRDNEYELLERRN